jgi:predicted deacylase
MLEIQRTHITGRRDGPHLLITGGVHGDEFEPMRAIRRLASEVDADALAGRLTLVPVANEAAFLRGDRTADDELDLARTCPGKPDGSITEQTAHALSELIRTADYYIDLHTGGRTMSVWPLVGYKLVPDARMLAAQRRMARAFNLPVVWGTDYRLQGRTLSVARDANIPSIYAEYLGSGLCDPKGVEAYVEGCLNVLVELEMLDRASLPHQPVASRIQYEVDDHRESAGHMQIRNPSPRTGFFEPAVQLGQRIAAGDALGEVSDALGTERTPVYSQESGIVIVLRTFSRVFAGDALAVILETDLPAHEDDHYRDR